MWFPSNRFISYSNDVISTAKHVHWQSWSDSNFDSHHGFPTCIDQISSTNLGQLPLLHSHTASQLRCTAHKMCTVVIGMGPGSSDACLGHADLHFWQVMCAPLLCSSCFHLWCSAGRMEGEQTGTCLLLCISIIDVIELPAVFRSWACVCHLLGYCQSAVYAVLCSLVIF